MHILGIDFTYMKDESVIRVLTNYFNVKKTMDHFGQHLIVNMKII